MYKQIFCASCVAFAMLNVSAADMSQCVSDGNHFGEQSCSSSCQHSEECSTSVESCSCCHSSMESSICESRTFESYDDTNMRRAMYSLYNIAMDAGVDELLTIGRIAYSLTIDSCREKIDNMDSVGKTLRAIHKNPTTNKHVYAELTCDLLVPFMLRDIQRSINDASHNRFRDLDSCLEGFNNWLFKLDEVQPNAANTSSAAPARMVIEHGYLVLRFYRNPLDAKEDRGLSCGYVYKNVRQYSDFFQVIPRYH